MIEAASCGAEAEPAWPERAEDFPDSDFPVRETLLPEFKGPMRMARSCSNLFTLRLAKCG
tara:strand:+ start:340 stop:519 length:180 start_codon:yes stop_codon:yes gene_type:complete